MPRRTRPRTWIVRPPKRQISRRGPRARVVHAEPALPVLGSTASKQQRMLAGQLLRRRIPFRFEENIAGGTVLGGMRVDFLLDQFRPMRVIRIQGEYFHRRPGTLARDDSQAFLLHALGYQVIDVWTWDVEHRMEYVLRELLGVSA